MNNKECAEMFINAIKKLAANENNLENLECYLSYHFDAWMQKYANTPEKIATEMKQFAEVECEED